MVATFIRRVEKDFYLRALYQEKLPVTYMFNREEYLLTVIAAPKEHVYLLPNRPIEGLGPRQRIVLMFQYRGHIIKFTTAVVTVKAGVIVARNPEFISKDLVRSFARVDCPADLKVLFSLKTERYALNYPKIPKYEEVELPDFMKAIDPGNLSDLTKELFVWAKGAADGYKVNIFKSGAAPEGMEERILCETGKILYLHSTWSGLPKIDTSPRQRLITEKQFLQYLERTGFHGNRLDDSMYQFMKAKINDDIASEMWVPILFQEYIIGYIRVWTKKNGARSLNQAAVEVVYNFAKTIAFSLKAQGYFNAYLVENKPFKNLILDISASGLFFAYSNSSAVSTLYPGTKLLVRLETPERTITTETRVVRHIKGNTVSCVGCQFLAMDAEDRDYLFEFIYGRPFTPIIDEAPFLVGQA
jgi:hypothetical protein